ncbi:type I-E CRISPR-associated protein Cse1/CasA [uncultured Thiohalocapsa sp.]|uniref:type I-E CRISPR-associated protein Cse1/CasA n=1 Tax=uncultured Thiohalocapsa sp. TaxID=768990 RepID=UPI0025D162D9|nr:type I-E CRISPR-associated protein Cse1/CasA [uncultured Thiohalocapsa sp.]
MQLNLLIDGWFRVGRAQGHGASAVIAPWQITESIDNNPIIALDTPRPDFNGALAQFLIGLLQTAFAPADADEWFDRLESPPDPATLRRAFAPYAHAFELGGDGPRFMQDQDTLGEQTPLPITALLIDTAGSETHFVKHFPADGFSPAMAALALYTLQTNAPSGGAGHRTSLRGGGPLTTLVVAAPEDDGQQPTLWQTLWLNVLDEETLGYRATPGDAVHIFPWLGPTRTSEKGKLPTTHEDVHPLQMFWGMPRRIRLDLECPAAGVCGIDASEHPALVTRYRTKNYGTNYGGAWQHTLTPYTHKDDELSAVHPRSDISYRNWLGLVQEASDKTAKRVPARVVSRFWDTSYRLRDEGWRLRLWAFGYDMDNMKPRRWVESTLPLFHIDPDERAVIDEAANHMIEAASLFFGNLRSALKDAWFAPNDPRRKSTKLDHVEDAFWQETEPFFYAWLRAVITAEDFVSARFDAYQGWHRELMIYTLQAFDRWADYNQITEQSHPRRIAAARRALRRFNYKKQIKNLLDIPEAPRQPAPT